VLQSSGVAASLRIILAFAVLVLLAIPLRLLFGWSAMFGDLFGILITTGRSDTARHSSAHCRERPPTQHGQLQGMTCVTAYLGFVAAQSLSVCTVL
jgi:hypothetical protein